MFDYAVLGLGKTGLAVLRTLCKEKNKKVLASDSGNKPGLKEAALKAHPEAQVEAGGHSDALLQAKLVIKSPGMHPHSPILEKLKEAKIPVVSEIEFAQSRFVSKPSKIIAVTGTNGKTTTTDLIGHLLRESGRKVVVGGNIGAPLIEQASSITPETFVVLELSSYQLEDSSSLHLDCGIVMNITPDHLDHHGSMEAYVGAKAKLLDFVRRGLVVLNFEDSYCRKFKKGAWKQIFFSSARSLKEGAWMEGGKIHVQIDKSSAQLNPAAGLIGAHNLENQMAAGLAALYAGLNGSEIQAALDRYQAPPHRLERVGEIRGILFINDSKATNVDSTVVALKAVAGEVKRRGGTIHLLLGGLDKGFSYQPIVDFKEASMKAYAYGASKEKIMKEAGKALGATSYENMKAASSAAFKAAKSGDIVLLSPACASFDQFSNFEQRGDQFRSWVQELEA